MSKKTVNALSYFAFIIAAALMLLGGILNGSITAILSAASTLIMYGVIASNAYEFVSKKSKSWKITYYVAFVVALLSIVLPFIL